MCEEGPTGTAARARTRSSLRELPSRPGLVGAGSSDCSAFKTDRTRVMAEIALGRRNKRFVVPKQASCLEGVTGRSA
jgi:hypothetical protein